MRRHPKRPRDMMQLAKLVGEITVGDVTEQPEPVPNEKAVRRGNARATKLSAQKRKAIAKKAARTRWERKGR